MPAGSKRLATLLVSRIDNALRFSLHPLPAWVRPSLAGCVSGVECLLLHLPHFSLSRARLCQPQFVF